MSSPRVAPLWAGRGAALVAILLMAINLRTAVAAISPITNEIAVDIPLDSVSLGLLGALPPIAFALSGLVAPVVAHKLGLEFALVLASAAMIVGHVVRAASGSFVLMLVGSIIVLGGMGFGNILLPPAVKRYFPDRIGLVTTAYVTMLSFSTAVPAILAAPIAGAASWRISLGVWAILSLGALLPWVLVAVRRRREAAAAAASDATPELDEAPPQLARRMWHSRTAWALALAFAASSFSAYAVFAWLPELLIETAGVTTVAAGALLALYGLMGLPFALVVPVLAARLRNVGWLIQVGVVCFLLGYAGLLIAPEFAPWLWVILFGSGPLLFPVCLVLINLRTRSPKASTALSGFVQGVGYTIGAFGPVLVGVLHDATGGWIAPIILLVAVALAAAVSGLMLSRPRFIEDELAS